MRGKGGREEEQRRTEGEEDEEEGGEEEDNLGLQVSYQCTIFSTLVSGFVPEKTSPSSIILVLRVGMST